MKICLFAYIILQLFTHASRKKRHNIMKSSPIFFFLLFCSVLPFVSLHLRPFFDNEKKNKRSKINTYIKKSSSLCNESTNVDVTECNAIQGYFLLLYLFSRSHFNDKKRSKLMDTVEMTRMTYYHHKIIK